MGVVVVKAEVVVEAEGEEAEVEEALFVSRGSIYHFNYLADLPLLEG